ncbi:MAG: ABC transporter ATP-binding protein, partial [Planctomycetota bacterium]
MLVSENLKKTYRKGANEVHSLRGVDLEVAQGELAFIVGPSGSGKSTLLHILGALDRPTSGRLLLDGEDVFSRTDRELALLRRKRFGFVFQAFNLVTTLTALDNVLCPLIPEKITSAKRQDARSLLADLGLAEREHHKPYEL